MKKILSLKTVSSCGNCPFRSESFDYKVKADKYKCYKAKRIIKNIQTIPDWCPLEDYKDENN